MSEDVKKNIIKYGSLVIVTVLYVLYYLSDNNFTSVILKQKYLLLSNAFFVPGILFLLVGLLIVLANNGATDGIIYVLQRANQILNPFSDKTKKLNYREFVLERRGKEHSGTGFVLVVGIIDVIIALVFVYLFYRLNW